MSEQRQESNGRDRWMEMLVEVHRDTGELKRGQDEIKTALFGPPGQEFMGFISRTEIRLHSLEQRMWGALVGVISAMIGTAWHWIGRK